MKNLFLPVLILTILSTTVAGRVYAVGIQPHPKAIAVQTITDNRVIALRNVLENYGSPLAPYAKDYVDAADKYDMDWKLLPAIAGLESSYGIHQPVGSNNSYGWGGGRIHFDSVEEGINTVLAALKNKYAARGATTVETIAPIYSESATWAPRVRIFMNSIEAEYNRIGMENLSLTI